VSSTMKLVAASAVALLIGSLSYWILKGSWQSVAPQSSAPPASTAAAPPASPVAPPTMPPTSTAEAPSAPLASPPTAPPASTAAATSAPLVATSTAPPTSAEAPPAPPASPPTAPPASTAAATSAPPSLPAEANMSEANRRQIQEALRRLDYYKGPVDGIFGTLTRAAIRRFQHEIGADTTGRLTAEEANRLVTSR
jgi:Putative peptidoglycan binding domain